MRANRKLYDLFTNNYPQHIDAYEPFESGSGHQNEKTSKTGLFVLAISAPDFSNRRFDKTTVGVLDSEQSEEPKGRRPAGRRQYLRE